MMEAGVMFRKLGGQEVELRGAKMREDGGDQEGSLTVRELFHP